MTRSLFITGAVALVILAPALTTASAEDGFNVRATLVAAREVPPIASESRGTFRAEVDSDGRRIDFVLRFSELEGGAATVAHIHFAPPRVNGGVIAFLCGGGGQLACPAEGTVTGAILPSNIVGPIPQGIDPAVNGADDSFDELVRAIRQGLAYANVHNARFTGGEIRGQIALTGRGGRD